MRKPPPSAIRLRGVRYPSAAAIPPKVWLDDKLLSLEKSLRVKAYNIYGFGWGRDGKGASQLALAICTELYTPEMARLIAVHFRALFLDGITGDNFDVTLDLTEFNQGCLKQLV